MQVGPWKYGRLRSGLTIVEGGVWAKTMDSPPAWNGISLV